MCVHIVDNVATVVVVRVARCVLDYSVIGTRLNIKHVTAAAAVAAAHDRASSLSVCHEPICALRVSAKRWAAMHCCCCDNAQVCNQTASCSYTTRASAVD